jgi:L-ornithine Nalpha-acyltransferase
MQPGYLNSLKHMVRALKPAATDIIRTPSAPFGGRREIVRDTQGLPVVLGRLGALEVRLATTRTEIRQAQRLRYQVFFEEMSAVANTTGKLMRRDKDAFDRICDHLLVTDTSRQDNAGPLVVGTYRLLRQDVAEAHDGFYTEREFDIEPLLSRHPGQRFLELGRSCVMPEYRTKKTVELLWQAIWAYVLHHQMDVMFGCASLEGTDPDRIANELAFLHGNALTRDVWYVRALPERFVAMNRMARDAVNARAALSSLPPLIKGYLRLGARIGDGAVIDRQFGTTDVLIVLRVAEIDPRYIAYYGPEADRFRSGEVTKREQQPDLP